ncbi:Cobalt-zinc-cadmium resistance protein CzcA; Cation efflux system protein CusA [hydrothermal vent metagenome]|uniref:Cobalt-zinc-cadmium resistance protein CzcA Cation efflux system protein CusA n=1 Tax=hydrothermal vent metagenome TaxID=652676 RepID=A0A3B1DHC1_9ZZZZ
MIAKLIDWCINNRMMVMMLTGILVAGGIYSAKNITVDAIPDLSDVQVVIRTEYPGQAPQIIEDQVTYPLTTAMLAVPYAEVVRGYSMFGSSFVYIIFEDGTDLYWARSRVLEQLSTVTGRLPQGVAPQLGPDATGVGWVYQYVLTTGPYCPDHPQGLWYDEAEDAWYGSPEEAPEESREYLEHRRVFDAGTEVCPLDGLPVAQPTTDLAELRSLQDWYLRYELTAVKGVSEIAGIGGYVRQYQVVVDPVRLRGLDISLSRVKTAIRRSNIDVGGRLFEMSETEYMVRGLGYLGTPPAGGEAEGVTRADRVLAELGQIALAASPEGQPIYLADVADIRVGPDIRRGIGEWNGEGEAVGGVVIMRFGENAHHTIKRVQARLDELQKNLPAGVAIEVAYDRSDLIDRAVETLVHTLTEEIMVVSIVIVLFLLHARSAFVVVFVLPTGVFAALGIMYALDINANIMSLGGIAISIGVMVDSSIIMVENAHKHLEDEKHRVAAGGTPKPHSQIISESAREVGPTLFFSLLIITASFLPIFVLGEQSGRLFKPLAFTKTFAIFSAAILAITIIPVLMLTFICEKPLPIHWNWRRRWATYVIGIAAPAIILAFVPLGSFDGKRWVLVIGWAIFAAITLLPQRIIDEQRNPISIFLQKIYDAPFRFVMQYRGLTLVLAGLLLASTLYPLSKLGSEFMPPLEEGDLLYMPTTDPGLSITKAREVLQQTDKLIASFPEVEAVFGKVGRADTATDPAPLSMLESTITLERDKSKWRHLPVPRFHDDWPDWLQKPARKFWPTSRPITTDELIYGYEYPDGTRVDGLNDIVQLPGLTNAWTMPIRTRIDMLSTGIRTPVGVKVMGEDLATLAGIAEEISQVLMTSEGTGAYTTSAFPEKSVGGNYLDIRINREEIARYGLLVADVQDVVMSAVGGMNVSETVEGLERYPINVRYPAELRDSIESLKMALVATPSGAQIPLGQVADIEIRQGPPMVKSENARLTSWVYVDIAGLDVGTYVRNAQRAVAAQVELPPGYSIVWSGQYEYMQAARAKLMIAVPLTGVVILLLLYIATKSWLRVGIVLLAVPFSLIGSIWLLYFLDYNMSLAVWVGMIALAGLDAETGLVMLLYLENSHDRAKRDGKMRCRDDLWWAVHDGAVQRIRPKTMTVVTTFMGLIPLMWADGAGADTMRRLAAPMIGGLASSFVLELLVYPVLFYTAKSFKLPKRVDIK